MVLNGHLGQRAECAGTSVRLLVLSAVLGKHKHKQLISSLGQSTTSVPCLILNVIKFCYNCLGVPLFCWIDGLKSTFLSWRHDRIFELDLKASISDSEQKIIIPQNQKGVFTFSFTSLKCNWSSRSILPSDWLEHLAALWGGGRLTTVFVRFSDLLWTLEWRDRVFMVLSWDQQLKLCK